MPFFFPKNEGIFSPYLIKNIAVQKTLGVFMKFKKIKFKKFYNKKIVAFENVDELFEKKEGYCQNLFEKNKEVMYLKNIDYIYNDKIYLTEDGYSIMIGTILDDEIINLNN